MDHLSNLSIRRLFHCSNLELTLSSVSMSWWDDDEDFVEEAEIELDEEEGEDEGGLSTSNFSRIFSIFIILLVGLDTGLCKGGGLGFSSSSSSRTVSLCSDPTQSEPFRARNSAKESLSLLCFDALNRTPIFLSSPQS